MFFAETRSKIIDIEAKVNMFESNMEVILSNVGDLSSFLKSDGLLLKAELNSVNAQLSVLNDNITSLAPLLRNPSQLTRSDPSQMRRSNPSQLPTVPLR